MTTATVPALRPSTPDDREFLLALYASTRAAELDQVAWAPGARDAFVASQFALQDHHYRTVNPGGRFDVVELVGTPIGRLFVDQRADDLRVVDLALVPEHRGRGLGTALLRSVLDEAAAGGRTASIHVEVTNPAARLYERLGFREVSRSDVYRLLRWSPGTSEIPESLADPRPESPGGNR